MRSNKQIHKGFAALLLGIFILCNTPTSLLHYLFANHADETVSLISTNSPVYHEAGIDCHCTSNVVNAPYVFEYKEVRFVHPVHFHEYQTPTSPDFHPVFQEDFSLRGPPLA